MALYSNWNVLTLPIKADGNRDCQYVSQDA